MAPVTDSMDPNAIQNAANQNTAEIQARQAQAAAAQAQAAQERASAQQQAAQQQAAQQQVEAQAAAQQAAAQQVAEQRAAAQRAARVAAEPPGTGCQRLSSYQVSLSSRSVQGAGHCSGEVTGTLTNDTNIAVDCVWGFHKNGGYNGGDNGEGTVQPGQTTGGETGGLWTCGADDSQMRYACFAKNSTDVHGNLCWSTVKF